MNTSKAPAYNQNKSYESNAQEKKNLMKMPGAFKQMSPISKHMSTPMQMGGSKIKGSGMPMNNPIKKTKNKIEQDLSRNQIRDKEDGDTKAANYEKKELIKVASGEQKR
tara:strand:- start:43 stop:369 length:327 start_codon:yes stop_codon:yes gene_type:complete